MVNNILGQKKQGLTFPCFFRYKMTNNYGGKMK